MCWSAGACRRIRLATSARADEGRGAEICRTAKKVTPELAAVIGIGLKARFSNGTSQLHLHRPARLG